MPNWMMSLLQRSEKNRITLAGTLGRMVICTILIPKTIGPTLDQTYTSLLQRRTSLAEKMLTVVEHGERETTLLRQPVELGLFSPVI